MEAAAEARILKNELVRSLRVKEQQVFLDSGARPRPRVHVLVHVLVRVLFALLI